MRERWTSSKRAIVAPLQAVYGGGIPISPVAEEEIDGRGKTLVSKCSKSSQTDF
jgi:hypothetical protein